MQGLQAGGNDYVSKPFGQRELVARIQAQLLIRQFSQGVSPGALAPGGTGMATASSAGGAGMATTGSGRGSSLELPRAASAPPAAVLPVLPGSDSEQQGAAAPAANGVPAASAAGSTDLQRQVEVLQAQLLATQTQLAALTAANGRGGTFATAVPEPAAAGTAPAGNGACRSSSGKEEEEPLLAGQVCSGTCLVPCRRSDPRPAARQ